MSCTPRITVVGVLLFMLAFSALQASPAVPQARSHGRAESADLMAAWDWLAFLFLPQRPHVAANTPAGQPGQPKEGSQLDPNGGNH